MSARRWLMVVVVGVIVASACGSSSKSNGTGYAPTVPTTSAQPATPPALTGTGWVLVSYRGAAAAVPAAANGAATLRFEPAGKLSGSTGCNSFGGTYTADAAKLTITLGAMTQMACTDPKITAQEHAVTQQLPKVTGYAIANGTLTLTGSAGTLFTYRAATTTLPGTAWTVTGVNNGKGAVESTALTEKLTATFGTDGTFHGFGGCNQLSGGYKVTGSNGVTIGPLMQSKKACGTAVDQLEAEYSAALSHVASFDITGDTLTLRDTTGATQVVAKHTR